MAHNSQNTFVTNSQKFAVHISLSSWHDHHQLSDYRSNWEDIFEEINNRIKMRFQPSWYSCFFEVVDFEERSVQSHEEIQNQTRKKTVVMSQYICVELTYDTYTIQIWESSASQHTQLSPRTRRVFPAVLDKTPSYPSPSGGNTCLYIWRVPADTANNQLRKASFITVSRDCFI